MKEPPLLTNGHAVVFVLGLILGALGAGRVDTWLDDHRGCIGVRADGSALIKNVTFENMLDVPCPPSLRIANGPHIPSGQHIPGCITFSWGGPPSSMPDTVLTREPRQ